MKSTFSYVRNFSMISSILLLTISSVAQGYVVAGSKCYPSDSNGRPFGSEVNDTYCLAKYVVAGNRCYPADYKGVPYGQEVADGLCQERGGYDPRFPRLPNHGNEREGFGPHQGHHHGYHRGNGQGFDQRNPLACKISRDGHAAIYDLSRNKFVDKFYSKSIAQCEEVIRSSNFGLTCASSADGMSALYSIYEDRFVDEFYNRSPGDCLRKIQNPRW